MKYVKYEAPAIVSSIDLSGSLASRGNSRGGSRGNSRGNSGGGSRGSHGGRRS